jgi:hypothetical protein
MSAIGNIGALNAGSSINPLPKHQRGKHADGGSSSAASLLAKISAGSDDASATANRSNAILGTSLTASANSNAPGVQSSLSAQLFA